VDEDGLLRVLEAARRSPSSWNEQRWDFVVTTDREQLQQLSEVHPGAGHVGRAGAAIVLVAPISEDPETARSIEFDLGQAAMSILLTATDLGLASAHASIDDQERARAIFGIPDDRYCVLQIAIGHPADGPLRPLSRMDRRPLDDVVHRGAW
jgi:nitroreductase